MEKYTIEAGTKFGKWTVLGNSEKKGKNGRVIHMQCQCECGTIKDVPKTSLVTGATTQCKKCRESNLGMTKQYDANRLFTHLTEDDLLNEEWRQYKDSPYFVSNLGRVKNIDKDNYILSPQVVSNKKYTKGYLQYYIATEGCTLYAHRLVGELFFENWNKKLTINHIKPDSYDNRLCNLEQMTQGDNVRNARNIKVRAIGKDGEIIAEADSLKLLSEATGYSEVTICNLSRTGAKTRKGIRFERLA